MFRPRLRTPRLASLVRPLPAAARPIHVVPELPLENLNFVTKSGEYDFLSPDGMSLGWTQYMDLAIKKLNAQTAGNEYENADIKRIIERTARNPAEAPIFNYASMAHNTEFFFRGISSNPGDHKIPDSLMPEIEKAFGSLETLRREFLVTALAMFGPGHVWLVKTRTLTGQEMRLRLLPTYLAGTPYPSAHFRRQGVDMNTVAPDGPEVRGVDGYLARMRGAVAPRTLPAESSPFHAATLAVAPGGVAHLEPLLCLSTWEHIWLFDYGILTPDGREGKRMFVEDWWRKINWQRVNLLGRFERVTEYSF